MASAQARGLDKFIEYRGSCRLERIVEAIASCDVGVIPNHKNIFTELNTPTRIFECLALGKPVIAPRARGIQDYFGDGSVILDFSETDLSFGLIFGALPAMEGSTRVIPSDAPA